MTAKQPAGKKYIVRLSADEREQLNALIQKGNGPARRLLKARILLKADASAGGEARSDGQIAGIALTKRASMATRNVRHCAALSAPVVNPWAA